MGRKVSPPISLLRFFDFLFVSGDCSGAYLTQRVVMPLPHCVWLLASWPTFTWVCPGSRLGPAMSMSPWLQARNQATICSALALLIQQVEDTFHIEGYSMLRNGLCALIITAYLSVEQQIPSCSSEVKKHFYCYSHVSRKHLQLHWVGLCRY